MFWTVPLSETCTVLFQNKFEKLVHLAGFNIGIYHNARSPERQILWKQRNRLFITKVLRIGLPFFPLKNSSKRV